MHTEYTGEYERKCANHKVVRWFWETVADPVTVLDALEHMLSRARSHSSTFEAILNETKMMGQSIIN